MTNEEKILAEIEELKKNQDVFVAEWRAARAEAKDRQEQSDARLAEIRLRADSTRKKFHREYLIALGAVVVAVVAWLFVFEGFPLLFR